MMHRGINFTTKAAREYLTAATYIVHWSGEFASGCLAARVLQEGRGEIVVENVANSKFTKLGNLCYCCTCSQTHFTLCSAVTVICKEIVSNFVVVSFPMRGVETPHYVKLTGSDAFCGLVSVPCVTMEFNGI